MSWQKLLESVSKTLHDHLQLRNDYLLVAGVLERLGVGHAVEALIADSQGQLCREAIAEATALAAKALARQVPSRPGAAGLFWMSSS